MTAWLIKFVVSVAVLLGVFYFTDGNQIYSHLKQVSFGWLVVALSALTLVTLLTARRWQLVAQSLGLTLDYRHAVREYYLSQLINVVLPGGVAGDATRAVRLRSEGDLLRATQSVIMERFIGQVLLMLMMCIGFALVLLVPGGTPWPLWSWWIIAVVIVISAITIVIVGQSNAVATFLSRSYRLMRMPLQIVLSVTIALLISVAFYACTRATGTLLPLSTLFTLIPLLLTSMLIPLSVGGWGWREGAAAALFPLAGAPASAGIAAGMAYGAVVLVAALPAVLIFAFAKRRAPSDPALLT